MKNNIFKNAFFNALATALYIAAVASFLFYASKFFGPRTDIALVPMAMLSLFVFFGGAYRFDDFWQAGTLVFGRQKAGSNFVAHGNAWNFFGDYHRGIFYSFRVLCDEIDVITKNKHCGILGRMFLVTEIERRYEFRHAPR